jgi:hypothetical protein
VKRREENRSEEKRREEKRRKEKRREVFAPVHIIGGSGIPHDSSKGGTKQFRRSVAQILCADSTRSTVKAIFRQMEVMFGLAVSQVYCILVSQSLHCC